MREAMAHYFYFFPKNKQLVDVPFLSQIDTSICPLLLKEVPEITCIILYTIKS